jgi:phospho-N-acetylmuramoyl-pentapeptide-transferase
MIALLIAVGVSFFISVFLTPMIIKVVKSKGAGQFIRDDGPIVHPHILKAGTPTMGGLAIVLAVLFGYFISHFRLGFVFGRSALTVLIVFVALAALGLIDDYLSIIKKRNLGLRKRGKIIGQLLIAGSFAYLVINWVNVSTELSFARPFTNGLSTWVYALILILILIGATNAVNITDGLDGLASGSATLVFSAYTIISFWQFRHPELYSNSVSGFSQNALDLSVLAASIVGACAGFLWWNAAPAQIFMGDVGSLAIGGALASFAVVTKTELLLVFIGGIYVIETLSVIAQIISYRGFKKRILKMAPIHHHFEVLGWPETTVIVRFWLFSGACVAIGLGIFYADFVTLLK